MALGRKGGYRPRPPCRARRPHCRRPRFRACFRKAGRLFAGKHPATHRLSPARDLPAPPSPEEARILRRRPYSEQALSAAGACRKREYAQLIREAARSRTHLRLLGAYLYGIYVESCHLTSLLPPEETACAGSPACLALRRGLSDRLGRGLRLLGGKGMLGNGVENERRAALVEQLQGLLAAGGEADAAARLREIVSLTREERARHLLPFLP